MAGKPGLMMDEKFDKFMRNAMKSEVRAKVYYMVSKAVRNADISTRVERSINLHVKTEVRDNAKRLLARIANPQG
jgi:hypothetical protein